MTEDQTLDRALIADAVEHELYRHPDFRGNWTALERESRVSHSTMSRLKRADERVTTTSMRKVEAALGLPFDSLTTLGTRDLEGLRELGVGAELLRWLAPKLGEQRAEEA